MSKQTHDDSMMMASAKAPEILPTKQENQISSFLQALNKPKQTPSPIIAPVVAAYSDDESSSYSTEESAPSSYDELPPTTKFEHLFMTEPEHTEQNSFFSEVDGNTPHTTAHNTDSYPSTDSKQKFTFDDIPPSKWRDRCVEMLSWCSAELQYYDIDMVIKRFLTRSQGRLRDWYLSLGEYRQNLLHQCQTPEAFIHIIHGEFVGDPVQHNVRARDEFLKMKCCSFQQKDLEKHYNRMSERFYCISGVDDVNLKQVFLNSFPESLANEAFRALENKGKLIKEATLGELLQLIMNALSKLCNQKKFLIEFEKTGRRLGAACDDKHLKIKCKDESSCNCSSPSKKSKVIKLKKFSNYFDSKDKRRKQKKSKGTWKFLNKKKWRSRDADRCYVCNKGGHFAKDCPDKRKTQMLLEAINKVEEVDIDDLESLYSLEDEPGDKTICSIFYESSEDESESSESSESSDSDTGPMPIYMAYPLPHSKTRKPDPSTATRIPRQLMSQTDNQQWDGPCSHVKDSLPKKERPFRVKKKIVWSIKKKKQGQPVDVTSTLKIPAQVDKAILQKGGGKEKASGNLADEDKERYGDHGDTYQDSYTIEMSHHFINSFLTNAPPLQNMLQSKMPPTFNPWPQDHRLPLCGFTVTHDDPEDPMSKKKAYINSIGDVHQDTHQLTFIMSTSNSNMNAQTSNTSLLKDLKTKKVPEEVIEVITKYGLTEESNINYKTLFYTALRNKGLFMEGVKLHLDYPFLNVFRIKNLWTLPKEALAFLWYLTEEFVIHMAFNSTKLITYLLDCDLKNLSGDQLNTLELLQWFQHGYEWIELMKESPKKHCIVRLYKPSRTREIMRKNMHIMNPEKVFIQGWYDMNPAGFYYQLNYKEEWMKTRKEAATENAKFNNTPEVEKIPPHILDGEKIWEEDDPQAEEFEKAQIDYLNSRPEFTHPPEIVVPSPRSVFDLIPDADPTAPLFTLEFRNWRTGPQEED